MSEICSLTKLISDDLILDKCNTCTCTVVGFSSLAPSPAHSAKGGADGTASQTPSGEKDEKRDEAGTPSSTAGREERPPRPRSVYLQI